MSMRPLVADLLPEVVEGARRSFALLVDDVPPVEVIGFALYSDADGGTVVAAAGTRATYDALVAQHPGAADHLRWSAQEWGRDFMTLRERGLADPLGPVQQRLDALQDQADDGAELTFRELRSRVWELCAEAMAQIHASGWFDAYPHAVRVVEVSDHELAAEQQVGWIERCNPPVVAGEFAAYVATR